MPCAGDQNPVQAFAPLRTRSTLPTARILSPDRSASCSCDSPTSRRHAQSRARNVPAPSPISRDGSAAAGILSREAGLMPVPYAEQLTQGEGGVGEAFLMAEPGLVYREVQPVLAAEVVGDKLLATPARRAMSRARAPASPLAANSSSAHPAGRACRPRSTCSTPSRIVKCSTWSGCRCGGALASGR